MQALMRKIVMTSLIMLLFSLLSMTTARAATIIYLPLVVHQTNSAASEPNATFRLDHIRLWYVEENGGKIGLPVICGNTHKIQVHVFDVQGDSETQSRLNDVIVRVVHWERGQRFEEFRTTGRSGFERGVAEFEIHEVAEVSIFTDTDGRETSTHTVRLSTLPTAIPLQQIIQGGYCPNEASCRAFVNTNQCAGVFSWNVVFKRNY